MSFRSVEMEWSFLVYSSTIVFPILFFIFYKRRQNYSRLPPGPPGWPLFGHIFQLGTAPHRTIAGLKQKYGPVVWLKIGSVNMMVIQSADVANEFYKNHDLSFINRNITDVLRSKNYHKGSLALAPYGVYWRVMRRLCTVEMFVNKRINETESLRRKCTDNMLLWIEKEANSVEGRRNGIQVARYVFLASFNMIGNLMLSKDLVDPESKEASEFFDAMKGIMEWGGRPNISDLFSWLRWLDLQGLRRKMDRDLGKAIDIATKFVKKRIEERQAGGPTRKDFLDVLLDFEGSKNEPAKLSELEINIFILEMFLAGSETSSTSIEWALAELLRNPKAMVRVKNEISCVVESNRKFEESDIGKLPYLQAVIKETLRLHPPLPFLVPRKAIQDTNYMGYSIPKETQVFVNVWAIGRDEENWEEPWDFKPERFLGSNTDFKGQHFEFIPFGAGRRICPGLPLGHLMMHFLLGSLLHEFNWELDFSKNPNTIDMNELIGTVVRKQEPLKVVPTKRVS
ncbi:cytochrome P450 76A2-like [Olea europaea subsp. europaea]|uniref:Cytochrome P450 76A2-like n=2 Tax=Olea europaea subsp. europaea TaxID=158383 RepID=A0A8S0QM88_OLEEU|nr:cytochrome P450 76A2-like [Olea europaea subsp. europaea]